MTFQHPDIVIDTIWRDVEQADEECGVFAILDAAADPSIHDDVLASGVSYRCLYTGDIPAELAEVAPYLVRLERDDPATRLLIHNCWGKSWGIFFTSTAFFEGIHRHFRRFLKVRDEQGNSLYFRYYDPRVLRTYLPTCDRSELLFVFGPVRRFFVEDEDPDSLLEYVVQDEKFITYRRPVVPAEADDAVVPKLEPAADPKQEPVPDPVPDPEPDPEPEPVPEPEPRPEPEPPALPKVDLPPVVVEAPEVPEAPPAMPPMVVLPPPVEAEELAAQEQDDPAKDPSNKEFLLPSRDEPSGLPPEVAAQAARMADVPIGDDEATIVAGADSDDQRQLLMDMPLGDPLSEGTLLMAEDELFEDQRAGGKGEPEDPE